MYTYEYPRPALTVDAIVYAYTQHQYFILLIRRGIEPFAGKWALPGGFVNMDELLEEACIRELKEETGLSVDSMQQFKTFDAINRDPRHRTISVVHTAQLPVKSEVKGGDDALNAEWFSLDNLPELAFDHHKIIDAFFEGMHGSDVKE